MNQLIPEDSTNIVSINDLSDICAIEKMFSWSGKSKEATDHASPTRTNTHALPVHLVHTPSQVPTPRTFFTHGTSSEPPLPSHESSVESVTPKVNPTPCNNPPNPVPNVPADPDSDPSSSYYYFLDSSDSSDDEYSKQI